MALMSRWQVSNFLDSAKRPSWTPDFIGETFDFGGQPSALVMDNGTGKTSVADAMLWVLSLDQMLQANTAGRLAPTSSGAFSHIRVEFVIPSSADSDLFATMGERVAGEHHVFGIYANREAASNDPTKFSVERKFYTYKGVLEDVPVHREMLDDDGSVMKSILPDDEFLDNLPPGSLVHKVSDWRVRVDEFIPWQQVKQMVEYQKRGGGDKAASFYNVEPRPKESFDQAFFRLHVAPEILSGVIEESDGDKGAQDVTFESGLVDQANEVVRAKLATEEKRRRLDRLTAGRLELDGIARAARTLLKAQTEQVEVIRRHRSNLNLARLVLEGGKIPGMPLAASQLRKIADDAVPGTRVPVPEILRHICFDGTVRVHAGLFEAYSIPTRKDMESDRALRNALFTSWPAPFRSDNRAADLAFFMRPSHDEVIRSRNAAFVEDVQRVLFAQCPFPVRRRFEILLHDLRRAEREWSDLQDSLNSKLRLINTIAERLNNFEALENAFIAMKASDLFEDADLNAPRALKVRLERDKAEAERARDDHTTKIADFRAKKRTYDAVVAEFGNEDFDLRVEMLTQAADDAEQKAGEASEALTRSTAALKDGEARLDTAKTVCDAARTAYETFAKQASHLDQIEDAFGVERPPGAIAQGIADDLATAKADRTHAGAMLVKARDEHRVAEAAIAKEQRDLDTALAGLAEMAELAEAELAFRERQPNHDPLTFEEDVAKTIGDLQGRRSLAEAERDRLQTLAEALAAFTERAGSTDPTGWLLEKGPERERLLATERETRAALEGAQEKLTALESSPTAPSATDAAVRKAMVAAGLQDGATPLHQAITDRELDANRRRAFLSQFSALLFAPVFANPEHAVGAATALAARDIPMPVFLTDDVDRLVTGGTLRTTVSGALYHGVVAGITSRKVEAVLDPARLEQEKADLRAEIASLAQTCERLLGEIEILSPEGPLLTLARAAQTAVAERAVDRVRALDEAIAALREEESKAEALRTQDNRRLARDAAAYRRRGGGAAVASLKAAAEAASAALRSARTAMDTAAAAINSWTNRHQDAQTRVERGMELKYWIPTAERAEAFLDAGGRQRVRALHDALTDAEGTVAANDRDLRALVLAEQQHRHAAATAAAERSAAQSRSDAWVSRLKEASSFLKDGGIDFLDHEAATAASLRQTVASFDARLRFDFESAAKFKETTDGAVNQDRVEHARLKSEVADLERSIGEKSAFIEAHKERKEVLQDYCRDIERTVHAITREIENNTLIIQEIKKETSIDLASMAGSSPSGTVPAEIQEAIDLLENRLEADGAPEDRDAVVNAYDRIIEIVRGFGLKNANADIRRVRDALAATERAYAETVDHHTKASHLDQPTLVRLRAAKPEEVQGILDTIDAGIEREKQTWQEAVINEEKSRNELVGILKGLAISSADNLAIMQRVMAPTKDNAGFLIEAKMAENEHIEKLLTDLVEQVEVQRKRFDEDTSAGRDHRREEEFRQSLSRSVRNRIHESMFPGARVKVVHPLMREGRPFHFVKQGISGGQATALMLLWTIKAATYSVERSAVKRQGEARRRLRRASHSIIVVDGLFSDLSDPPLIRESMEAMKRVRGNYQLIGLIHSPFYRNDFDLFPTCLFGRKVSTVGEDGVEGKMVTIQSHTRDRAGRVGIAGLRARNTLAEAASRGRSSAAKGGADGESLDIFDSVIASTLLGEDEAATEDAR